MCFELFIVRQGIIQQGIKSGDALLAINSLLNGQVLTAALEWKPGLLFQAAGSQLANA